MVKNKKDDQNLKKFLKEVVGVIIGKQAEELAELLNSNKHVNEFLIAKKLDITINQARNLLYKVSDHGLVSSIRKKDKRKGWYTYFWKIEVLKSLEFLKDLYLKRMEQINNQIKSREVKQFYFCEKCNIEVTEENALLRNFTCNECGAVYTLKDNTDLVKEFKKNVLKIEKDLDILNQEIDNERERLEKNKPKEKLKPPKKVKSEKKKSGVGNVEKKIVKKHGKLKKPSKTISKKVKKNRKKKNQRFFSPSISKNREKKRK